MRPLLLLLVAAACSSPPPSEARVARWEIDSDGSVAVATCPHCGDPVAHDGTKCAECGAVYRVEAMTIDCPECAGTGHATPACAACEDTHKCAICDGAGVFDGAVCPECEGAKTCRECPQGPPRTCDNCLGTGKIEVK